MPLEPHVIGLAGCALSFGTEVGYLPAYVRESFVALTITSQFGIVVRQGVNHFLLEGIGAQHQILVLGMDVDEPFAETLELRQQHGRVVPG